MAKTSAELEKEFIDTAKEKTGRSLHEWLDLLKSSGIAKHADLLEWLKKGHGLNHLQAQLTTGIYLNQGKPVYLDDAGLMENQFARCPEMKPLFEYISDKLINGFQGTQLIIKKTYLSFTAVREFAAVNVKPGEIRLGLDLGDMPFTAIVQKSKLSGPMPRISHMLIFTEAGQFNEEAQALVQQSYTKTHKK